jgi:hypothetical protein
MQLEEKQKRFTTERTERTEKNQSKGSISVRSVVDPKRQS